LKKRRVRPSFIKEKIQSFGTDGRSEGRMAYNATCEGRDGPKRRPGFTIILLERKNDRKNKKRREESV